MFLTMMIILIEKLKTSRKPSDSNVFLHSYVTNFECYVKRDNRDVHLH